MSYQIINTNDELKQACEYFKDHEWVGFDLETTALDPFDGQIRLVQLSDGETTYIIDLWKVTELDPLRALLSVTSTRKVIHNAKFDTKWTKHHLGVEVGGVFCTMLASQMLAAGDQDHKHSLASVVERYLGIVVDKTEQASEWGKEELDPAQLEYAAKDAAILLPLKDRLLSELQANDLLRVAEIENECVVPVVQMELNGFYLDKAAWQRVLDSVRDGRAVSAALLQHMLGQTYPQPSFTGQYNINLDSPTQITDALKWAGVPINNSTQEWRLQPLAHRYPVVGTLLDYRGLSKAETSYGESWFDHINPQTGRVHAEFNQARAKTGRFGCSNPNLQQIPADSAYRQCFKAEKGNILVIADYSQIELRILAHRSGDKRFIAAFNSGVDLHTATASQVFNIPVPEVTPEQRSFAKRLNFGIVYGIGAGKFASLAGVSKVEAEEIMAKYFRTFDGLSVYLRDTGRQSIVDRVCRTEAGRMLKLRFDEEDRGSVGAAKRNGINAPIQGTSADILKRALRLVHNSLRDTTGRLVNIVHDEIVVECDDDRSERREVAERLERSMVQAGEEFVTRVPIVVDVRSSYEWKK